jgi:fucose 4-O-acetylase-like acetyltransferase
MAKRLLLLNGVAILGVILFHATGFGFTAMFFWPHRYRPVVSPNFDATGGAAYYVLRVAEQLVASFCIPAFLFVSGYFAAALAGRSRAELNARTILARSRRLAIPYLVWSGVVLAALAAQGRIYSPARYVEMLLTGSSHPNYYFVPLLIQFYVISPLLVVAATRNRRALLAGTAALQLAVYGLQYIVVVGGGGADASTVERLAASIPKWLFVAHLFWFTAGLVAGFEPRAFAAFVQRNRVVWAIAAAVLLVAGVVEWEWLLRLSGSPWRENRITVIDGLYAGAAILALLGFADTFGRAEGRLADLGGKSFGIYLAHGVVMEYAARGIYHVAPAVLAVQPVFQAVLIALGLIVPLAMMAALKRSRASGWYPYVFG